MRRQFLASLNFNYNYDLFEVFREGQCLVNEQAVLGIGCYAVLRTAHCYAQTRFA